MPATLMQLRRLTRARLGIPASDDFITDPVLDDHINVAIQTIEAEYRWPWAEVVDRVTVSPLNPDIVVDDAWLATRAVFDVEHELYAVAPGDLLSYTTIVAGVPPRVWCPLGGAIAIRPTVTGERQLTHYWYRQPAWLREDGDVPNIPGHFAGAIIAKAAELLAARESSGSDAARHGAEYATWMTRMRRDVRRTTGPTRPRVRPGGWI